MKNIISILFVFICLSGKLFSKNKETEITFILERKSLLSNDYFLSLMKKHNATVYKSIKQVNINNPLSKEVDKHYMLSCNCNGESLIRELKSKFSNNIISSYNITPNPLLYTPNDYNLIDTWVLRNWATEIIRAKETWDITKGNSEIKVGFSDVGFDLLHLDIINKIDYVHPNCGIVSPTDKKGHGISTSSIACAETDNGVGISAIGFDSRLIYIPMSIGNYFDDAIKNGARIINCSWGLPQNLWGPVDFLTLEYNTIEATNKGVILVCSAGNGEQYNNGFTCFPNNGNGHNYHYPASFDNVISVSGISQDNTLVDCGECTDCNCRWWWNNGKINAGDPALCYDGYNGLTGCIPPHTHNDKVDILAPGFCVNGLQAQNSTSIWGSGTSQAAPLVSGTVALMLSVNPCLGHDEVESILKSTGVEVSSYGNNQSFYPNSSVPKRMDAYEAVLAAQNYVFNETIVANGVTETITGDGYKNNGYRVENGGELIFSAGSNSYMCRGGGVNIVVENGGTMIIEDDATVNVFKDGTIIVENGGQLIIKNTQPDKGLVLGQIEGHESAELRVEGDLIIDDGANLSANGNGFIKVTSTGSVTFGTNATVNWDMHNDGKLILAPYADIFMNPSYFNVRNGEILFENSTSKLRLNTNETNINNIWSAKNSGSSDMMRITSEDVSITNSEFHGSIKIDAPLGAAIPFLPTVEIENCTFSNNNNGSYALGLFKRQGVNIKSSTIESNNIGINAEYVYALSIEDRSLITNCVNGIKSEASNIFLRERSEVSHCDIGFNMKGNDANNTHSLLTIGDKLCGWVINNHTGVKAENVLLNADAGINSIPCLDCGYFTNRFDGNTSKAFSMCYTFNAPSQIHITGAYWGSNNPNTSYASFKDGCGVIDQAIVSNGGGVSAEKSSGGVNKSKDLAKKAAGGTPKTIPKFVGQKCSGLPSSCYCPYSGWPGPQPHDPNGPVSLLKALLKTGCLDPRDNREIEEKYRNSYSNLFNKNYEQAQTDFGTIGELPYRQAPGFFYKCEHLIRVSEILGDRETIPQVLAISTNNQAKNNDFQIQANNGSSYNLKTKNRVDEGTKVSLYSTMGVLIQTIKTTSVNKAKIDVSNISKGIYLVKIEEKSKEPVVEKIVVQ